MRKKRNQKLNVSPSDNQKSDPPESPLGGKWQGDNFLFFFLSTHKHTQAVTFTHTHTKKRKAEGWTVCLPNRYSKHAPKFSEEKHKQPEKISPPHTPEHVHTSSLTFLHSKTFKQNDTSTQLLTHSQSLDVSSDSFSLTFANTEFERKSGEEISQRCHPNDCRVFLVATRPLGQTSLTWLTRRVLFFE